MKTYFSLLIAGSLTFGLLSVRAQVQNDDVQHYPGWDRQSYRYNLNIPSIPGYEVLKCDFHIHTMFSDGQVWPAMRVMEAWNDGLDAIAITDHIEYRPNKALLPPDLNKSSELAEQKGNELGILVIRGTEITRSKPLGHINALFVTNVNTIDVKDELAAIDEAYKQGAFLLWNHPGWPDNKSTMYPVHKELIAQKKLHGAEVFNGTDLYPKVVDWCKEYGLTFASNSDIHTAIRNAYPQKMQRPMTLVFTKEKSLAGIKEALKAGRTLALSSGELCGKEEYIKEIIRKSVSVRVLNEKKGIVEIRNNSDLDYSIKPGNNTDSIPVFANQTLKIAIPLDKDLVFSNCRIGKDKFVAMKLW